MFFKGIHQIIGATAFGLALTAAAPSYAVAIQGTSTGQFSNVTSCGSDCSITSSGTQLNWGSTSRYTNLVDPSTLKANPININTSTNSNDTLIGELTWYNSSTRDDQTPDQFGATYKLTINFTSPYGSLPASQTFNLTITNTDNPSGDRVGSFKLTDLTSMVFDLPGVTVSDLHYGVDHSTLSNNIWYNTEDNTAHLFIYADFKATTPAPEPASLALMGAGLAGVARLRRKKKN